jgi:hypothetical protein
MEVFPKDRYDDLTDSTTQAIRYLRDNGLLRTDQEEHHWAGRPEAQATTEATLSVLGRAAPSRLH